MTVTDPLAAAWLERVELLAADLAPGTRAELLADLREHLQAALGTEPARAEVEAVLVRLGDPAEVVAAARTNGPPPLPPVHPAAPADVPEGLTPAETGALAVLVLSGLLVVLLWPVSFVLWVVGIVLVAVGGRWRGGEVVGMVLLPLAWAFPVASVLVPVGTTSQSCSVTPGGVETCTVETSGVVGPWALVAAVVVLVLIVLGTRVLARAPQGRPRRQ